LLCGAALATFLAINGPYIAALGLKEWIKWVIIFPLRYYPTLPAQTWRSPLDDFRYQTGFIRWICIPFVYLTIPLVYLVFLRVMHRRRRFEPDEPWNQLLLLAITGLALFIAVAPCLSVMRVSCASLPGMVLLAWLLNRWGSRGRVAAGALAALSRQGDGFRAEMLERCLAGRDVVRTFIDRQNRIRWIEPEGAFYGFLHMDGLTDSLEFARSLVKSARVGVAPGSAFGPAGVGHTDSFVRICFAQDPSLLAEGLSRIDKALSTL